MAQKMANSFLLVVLSLCHIVSTSKVAIYNDTECNTVISTLTAVNGYPDGQCATVAEETTQAFHSFQFLSLDAGCAATVYGADVDDGDSCSGYAIVASLSTCYNASWVDFSVDECTAPVASSNTTGNATSLPSTSSTPASTVSSSSSTSAPSSTESAKSGAPLNTVAQAGSLSLCSALVFGMYYLLM